MSKMAELDLVVNDILFRSLGIKVIAGKTYATCELGTIRAFNNMGDATAFIEGPEVNSAVLKMLRARRRQKSES
jgi:hypothetical protein